MNEWDQRIREHRVWAEMQSLGPAIDAALGAETIDPEAAAGLERLKTILAYCGKRIAAAEPSITVPEPLEAVATGLAGAKLELTAFVSDNNAEHVVAANQAADTALSAINLVPGAYSPEELGTLVAAATQYRGLINKNLASTKKKLEQINTASDEALANVTSKAEEGLADYSAKAAASFSELTVTINSLQNSLLQLTANIQAEQQKLALVASNQQGQFSVSQEARSKEFTDVIRQATQDLTKLVTDYQSQFSTAQDTRSKEFITSEAARQKHYGEAISEYGKKLAEQDAEFTKQRAEFVQTSKENLAMLTSEYEDKTKKILESVQDSQKHVEELVGVIGNLGVTSGYLRTANRAQWGMWSWQGMTVAAMCVLCYTAYKTLGLLENSNGQFLWGGFAARALLLASLGLLAAYSSSQADKLLGDERRNRKLALELEAIGPYLAPLPEEDRNKFRILIGDRSFGREQDIQTGTHPKSPASLLDLIKSKQSKDVVDFLIDLIKKAKDIK